VVTCIRFSVRLPVLSVQMTVWASITRSQRLGRCELEVLPAGIIGA
jgi:hypothetical protein